MQYLNKFASFSFVSLSGGGSVASGGVYLISGVHSILAVRPPSGARPTSRVPHPAAVHSIPFWAVDPRQGLAPPPGAAFVFVIFGGVFIVLGGMSVVLVPEEVIIKPEEGFTISGGVFVFLEGRSVLLVPEGVIIKPDFTISGGLLVVPWRYRKSLKAVSTNQGSTFCPFI